MTDCNEKVLVTGANGFIGKSLTLALETRNFTVLKLLNTSGGVCSSDYISSFPKVKYVIHLAGMHFVPDSWKSPSDFYSVNVVGTQNIIDFCLKHDAKLIFASTFVYGPPKSLPVSEKHPINCVTPYALSKYLAEEIITFNQTHRGLCSNILRLFNVYGPNQKGNYLIPSLISQAKSAKNFTVNTLAPKRDYVFVDDVVEAFVAAALSERHGSIYNIGSGVSYSVKEIIDIIKFETGVTIPTTTTGLSRPNEVMDVVSDNRLAVNDLGWRPSTTIEEGLAKMISKRHIR